MSAEPPYLPFYGVAAESDKGEDLKRLLDFFEEGLNAPTATI